jgi:sugar lactone lactonase YvrE
VSRRYGRRYVTSDGVALEIGSGELRLVRLSGSLSLTVEGAPAEAVIDDAGKNILYEIVSGAGRSLYHLDPATGETRLLAGASAPMQPCLSDDGRLALFLANAQVFVIATDGSGRRQLTSDPSGIQEIVFSGDGRVAYAVSGSGRLWRVDVPSGNVTQVIGPTVAIRGRAAFGPPEPAPGSIFAIEGSGFAESVLSAAAPLPLRLNGV